MITLTADQKEIIPDYQRPYMWELSEIIEDAGIKLDDIFRYYMHILRAKSGIISKEIGLRKFFAQDNNCRSKKLSQNKKLVAAGY
ncbi:hypothetical protein FACS1894172_16890 [Spirochaetia bacterium]|nr:hypothetical protein FACS1894172_16890 [Spirochaetia bacterium]